MKPAVFKSPVNGRWCVTVVGQPAVTIGWWNGYRTWHDAVSAALDFVAMGER